MISLMLLGELNTADLIKNWMADYKEINFNGVYQEPLQLMEHMVECRMLVALIDLDYYNLQDLISLYKGYKRKLSCKIEIVAVSSSRDYAVDAYEISAMDYILKPITKSRFEKTITKIFDKYHNSFFLPTKASEYQITCFGNFKVLRKGELESKLNWRTKKVKELFAYLICRYNKAITKEELIFNLFGNAVSEKEAQNNLYVTMSYLRKALGDFGLQREILLINKDYTLELSEDICDYVLFDQFITNNVIVDEHNIFIAEKIAHYYKGMLLDDEDYMWSFDLQQYCDKKYEELLFMISEYYKEKNCYKEYESFLLKVLSNNPMSIEANESLLNLYLEHRKKDFFIRQYQKYQQVIIEEYNDLPERKYEEYYRKIAEQC